MPRASSGKLKARFLGSYRVTEVINAVAVRLELPPQARLHDVFHVGTLKKFVGTPPASPPPLPDIKHGAVVPAPERVTQARLARGVRQVLVFWRGEPPSSATWEDLDDFRATYPDFQLEDELGRDVMWGQPYVRRRRNCDIRRAEERAARAQEEEVQAGFEISG